MPPLIFFLFLGNVGSITGDASFVLLVLTILVTPANIYMFTHGALLPPMAMEPVPVAGRIMGLYCSLMEYCAEQILYRVTHSIAQCNEV